MSGALEGGPDDSSSDATRHGQRTEPEARSVYALVPTRHGQRTEPEAHSVYALVHGCGVAKNGFWVHREHTWLGASRDGLVAPEGLLEIKCPMHQLHAVMPREYMA